MEQSQQYLWAAYDATQLAMTLIYSDVVCFAK